MICKQRRSKHKEVKRFNKQARNHIWKVQGVYFKEKQAKFNRGNRKLNPKGDPTDRRNFFFLKDKQEEIEAH